MVDSTANIGMNAGKIWNYLYEKGPLSEDTLLHSSGLKNNELYEGIGWLARENKIKKDNHTFFLGDTNLVSTIGKNAGEIWKILEMWGEVDIASISRLAKVNVNDVFSAIGWLAREDKIGGIRNNKQLSKIKVWLKQMP
jgi:hypothetical protein